jgi:hypothetical protein
MSHFGDLTNLSLPSFLFFLLCTEFSSKFLNMMIYISTLQLQHVPFLFSLLIYLRSILRAVAKLLKLTISFVRSVRPSICLSVCLSVCPHGTTQFPLDGFS